MAQAETDAHERRSFLRSTWSLAKALVSPQMSAGFFFLDFIVYPPIILFSFVWGLHSNSNHSVWVMLAMTLVGLVAWTLAEYLAHRFVLHKVPGISALHQAHHDETLELIGTPTLVSLAVLFTLAFWPMTFVFGLSLSWMWIAGFLTGFIAYTFAHYAVHHLSSGGYAFMKRLKWQHNVHHHGSSTFNYGVTTVFWDHAFGTYSAKMRTSKND
jgi:sterol desaturase/sphingolipid hydroxylase (fatty acid hydroxylase superfamily)